MEASPFRNRLLLVAAAVLFSTGGAAIKAATLTSWQIAGFRSGVAAIALLAFLPETRRNWSWRVLPVSACYAGTLILFVLATRMTTAANAIFLQSTAPLYLLLLGPFLLNEPIRRRDVGYIFAVGIGMSLFALGTERAATAPDPQTGNICALASGLTWAFALAGIRWLSKSSAGGTSLTAVAGGNIAAFFAAMPFALTSPITGWENLSIIIYLGVFQIGLAYVCLTRAMRHVTAFEATTVLLLEPALNPLWVWFVHGEKPGAWPLAGGAVILFATVLNTYGQRPAGNRAPG